MLPAALAFAVADVFGSVVSIREDVPGEPFRVSLPISVPTGVVVGWGAGTAAPWPMPLAALLAARSSSPRSRTVLALLGAGCVAGTFVEPVTYGRRSRSPWVAAAIALNLMTSACLLRAATRTSS